MSTMNLAEPLETAAWRLLEENKVLEHLRQVGEPKVHGSLELRTMAWPEIDIYVGVTKPTMADVCATLTQLANCVAMRDVHIINQVDFPVRYAAGGIMIVDVGIEWEKVEWKLDVALMPAEWMANTKSFNAKLLAEMTEEKRQRMWRSNSALSSRHGTGVRTGPTSSAGTTPTRMIFTVPCSMARRTVTRSSAICSRRCATSNCHELFLLRQDCGH